VHEVDFVCGICGQVVASVPDKIQFMSGSGPALFVCYACGAYNELINESKNRRLCYSTI
jgi:hypothetical protein